MNFIFNRFFKALISFFLGFYFKEWKVKGLDNIPTNKPVIFAPNHQSAFLDALIVTCSSNKLPFYLARAGVFENQFARKILHFIRMHPIYRFRDGLKNVKKNDEIIESCKNILNKRESLVIFPEGNHGADWNLRPLQRGLSRIAFKSEELAHWNLDLKVIPVGINYESPNEFRGRLLVEFGEPITVSDFKADYVENERNGFEALKAKIAEKISPLILNIPPAPKTDKYANYEEFKAAFLYKRVYKRNYIEQLKLDQDLIEAMDNDKSISLPEPDKKQKVNPLSFLFAFITYFANYFLHRFSRWFIRKHVTDPVYTSSIKFAILMLLAPVYYLIIAAIVGGLTGNFYWGLAVFLIFPTISIMGFDGLKAITESRKEK